MRALYEMDLKKMICWKLNSDLFHLPSLKFIILFLNENSVRNSGILVTYTGKNKWNVNHNSVEFCPYVNKPERKCLEVFSFIGKGYNNMKYNI